MSWQGIRNSGTPVKIGKRPLKNYIQRGPEELYDIVRLPFEIENLASDKDHQDILISWRQKVEKWQRETKDPWLFKDGVSLLEMGNHIENGLKVPDRFDFDLSSPGS